VRAQTRRGCVQSIALEEIKPLRQLIANTGLTAEVARYLTGTLSAATRRAYEGDVHDLIRWGASVPCSPATLSQYAAERAKVHTPSTIARRVVGIGQAHSVRGFSDPSRSELVRAVLKGIRRQHGTAQRQARPFLVEHVLQALELAGDTPIDLRDRALLLLGFATAMRRSELVALNVEDLAIVPQGMTVRIVRSKTDQEAVGRVVAVPRATGPSCPVGAVLTWLQVAGIRNGAVFRNGVGAGSGRLSAQSVSAVVKRHAARIGLEPSLYSAHSLRAGLVTSASRLGASVQCIQRQTGHRSESMVNRYVRDERLFNGSVLKGLL
jgi:integrase